MDSLFLSQGPEYADPLSRHSTVQPRSRPNSTSHICLACCSSSVLHLHLGAEEIGRREPSCGALCELDSERVQVGSSRDHYNIALFPVGQVHLAVDQHALLPQPDSMMQTRIHLLLQRIRTGMVPCGPLDPS